MVFLQTGRPGIWCIAIALLSGALVTALAQNPTPPISPKDLVPGQSSGIASPTQPPPATTLSIASSLTALQGLPVVSVEFRGVRLDPPVMLALRKMLAPIEGRPLDRQKVGQSLRELYATGRFADLQVEAQKNQKNEVSLVFVATENLFIGEVTVDGAPKRPTASQLIDASKLGLGDVFAPELMEPAIARMQQTLADNGYYQAKITVEVQKNPNIQKIALKFHVIPGDVARIGNINVEGDPSLSAAEVLKISKLRPGKPVSIQRLTSALQRLRKRFSKRNQLEAQISVLKKDYHPDSNTLDYTLRINHGPVIDIRVEGASMSKRQLQKYVPVYEEHAVDDDLLNEGRRNLRDYFQNKGYFDVSVDYLRKPEQGQGGRVAIIYDVDRGRKHDLEEVTVEGNKFFDSTLIKERMTVQKASWLVPHGRFSQELLARDLQNIKDLYLSNGFLQVKVTGDFQDNYRGHTGRMAVFVHIDEGPQTLVSSVAIDGNKAIPDQELQPLLTMQDGQAYSEANTLTDRDTVLNYYFNHGFPDATFTAKASPATDPQKMQVVYTIVEGPQVFVDRVLLSGLEFTRRGIVTRQFDIHAGDPLSQAAMLDTQRHLYDLGVFNAVDMAVANPEGTATYKDVFFQFEEAKRWTFDYGFGIEIQPGTGGSSANPQGDTSASPRVSLDITRNNVGGRAHTLTLKSHVGSLQQLGLISYDAPRFLRNENLRLTVSAFYNNSLDVRTFTSERLEGSVQVEQVLTRTQTHVPVTSLLYRFTYRRVRATDIVVDPTLIPLYSLPVRVGMPSLSYIRDRRDDPIDSHRGSFNTFDTGVASGVFGSEAAFGRFSGQNTTYHGFHKRNDREWVLARNTRLGVAEPFGSTHQLPLPERFFAGGAGSHRGFSLNQAGPRDLTTGQPLGGNAVFVNSVEVRTPPLIMPFIADNMSLAFFHDMGNVFATVTDMFHGAVRVEQPHKEFCTTAATASLCDFSYISHALGMGVRYKTPVGPVRLDFGYNLNPPVYPLFTTDPATKVTTFSSHTLRHFNFYFSIGQTF